MTRRSGGRPIHLALKPPDYRIDWDVVERAVSERTRAIMINSPHNPTGAVIDEADIAALTRVAEHHDLIVISDEVYEHRHL